MPDPQDGLNPAEIEIVNQDQYHQAGEEVDLDAMRQRPGGVQDIGQGEEGQAPHGDQELQAAAAAAAEGAMLGQEQQAGAPPAEPEWRAPLGEAVGGLASELRQWQQQFEQRMFAMQQQQLANNQRQPQPQQQQQPEQHPFEDPIEFMAAGADPKLVRFFQQRDQRYRDQIQQLTDQLNGFRDDYTRTQQGNQMAQYFKSHLDAAMQQTKLENETRQFLEPMMLGLALTSQSGNPYSVNVPQVVAGFARWLQARDAAREQAWKKKYSQAAAAQQGIPAPAPTGAQTMPAPAGQGRLPQNMDDMDAAWNAFGQRWGG